MILLHRDGVHLLVEAQNRRDPVRINGFPVNHIGHVVQGAAHTDLICEFLQLNGYAVVTCQHHLLFFVIYRYFRIAWNIRLVSDDCLDAVGIFWRVDGERQTLLPVDLAAVGGGGETSADISQFYGKTVGIRRQVKYG